MVSEKGVALKSGMCVCVGGGGVVLDKNHRENFKVLG